MPGIECKSTYFIDTVFFKMQKGFRGLDITYLNAFAQRCKFVFSSFSRNISNRYSCGCNCYFYFFHGAYHMSLIHRYKLNVKYFANLLYFFLYF